MPHGTFACLLAGTTQTDHRDAQHLSQVKSLDTSETRLAGEGELCERGTGYTFFWSGRGPEERREAGVGFAVRTTLVGKLAGPPKGVNDRLMTMRLPLSHGKKFATLVSAYAPTMTNPDEIKDKFYEDLNAVIATVPNADKLIILGESWL